jgi:hypothetical protein
MNDAAAAEMKDPGSVVNDPEVNYKSTYKVLCIQLTYPDCPTMFWWFRRQLGKELRKAREEFVSLSEEEQEQQIVSYRIKMMSNLAYHYPENVDDFPNTGKLAKDFLKFFEDEDNRDLLSFIWGGYQKQLYPKEIMSNPFE